MSKRKKASGGHGGLHKTVFCPECQTNMKHAEKKQHQQGFELYSKTPLYEDGIPVLVTRVFYYCPKCQTVVWFDFREDGKRGQLNEEIAWHKEHGTRMPGLEGSFNGLIDP